MLRSVPLVAALLAAFALTAAACDPTLPASPGPAGVSAGNWPQAADGVLDDKMCHILTSDDFAKYHRAATDKVETSKPYGGGNGIVCNYALNDTLTLELAPNAAVAGQIYQARLGARQSRTGASAMALVNGPVNAADESWFGEDPLSPSGDKKDTDLVARRGALLLQIHLQGWYPGARGSDPKDTSIGLADLVLRRAPDLGRTGGPASGSAAPAPAQGHHVLFTLRGTGKATAVSYLEPVSGKTQKLQNVGLPWVVELPLAAPVSGGDVWLTLTANSTNPGANLTCSIQIDGKEVVKSDRPSFLALCTYTWHAA
jgi:hypothetical protein